MFNNFNYMNDLIAKLVCKKHLPTAMRIFLIKQKV